MIALFNVCRLEQEKLAEKLERANSPTQDVGAMYNEPEDAQYSESEDESDTAVPQFIHQQVCTAIVNIKVDTLSAYLNKKITYNQIFHLKKLTRRSQKSPHLIALTSDFEGRIFFYNCNAFFLFLPNL